MGKFIIYKYRMVKFGVKNKFPDTICQQKPVCVDGT